MLRKMTALLSLILALGLTMGASAQEAATMEDELPGLESAYTRMFMPDFDAMFAALETPGAAADFEFDENSVIMVMTSVFTFDSEDNAGAALDTLHESFVEEGGDSGLEQSDIEDLGDKASMYSGNMEEGGESIATIMLLVQDGNYVYMITVGGGELEAGEQQAQDIAQFMVDAEITTDEVTFDADGASTGGVFDLMPTADDTELVSGLAPISDMDMLEDMGTPEI